MTVKERVLSTNERVEWREYYNAVGSPGPYHTLEYLRLLAGDFEHEHETAMAYVLTDDDNIVYYPFIKRPISTLPFADDVDLDLSKYSDIVSSWYYGGPILGGDTDPSFADTFDRRFDQYCRDTGIVAEFVRFDPNVKNHHQFESLEPTYNRKTVPVDLTRSREAIWEGYEGRNQRAIQQARETEILIEATRNPEDVRAFHKIYSNAMEARDATQHYRFDRSFFETLLERERLSTLLVVRYGDEVIGGFIVIHDETFGHHFLSASNPDYWNMRVNNLLYHEVVMYMQETGRELFDFQGGRPGVFRFKKGFSPDRCEFYLGKRIHDSDVYDELTRAAAAAGIDVDSGYFPAYREEQSN